MMLSNSSPPVHTLYIHHFRENNQLLLDQVYVGRVLVYFEQFDHIRVVECLECVDLVDQPVEPFDLLSRNQLNRSYQACIIINNKLLPDFLCLAWYTLP